MEKRALESNSNMNISQILPNVKGRTINRTNAATIADACESLPRYIVGKNGTIREDLQEISKKILNCGTGATVGTNAGESRILEMHRCGVHKLCPNCADAVSGDRIRKIDSALESNWTNAKYCYMVTYTIRDSESLFDAMQALKQGYRKFYLMGQKREKGYSIGEASKFLGGFNSIETKIGRNSKQFHPHLHQIVFTNEKIDFSTYHSDVKKMANKRGYKRGEDSEAFKKFMIENNGCKYLWENEKGNKKPCSKLSHEWRQATNGAGANCRVDVIWTPETRPEKFVSLFEKIKGLTTDEISENKFFSAVKSLKYALKYSVKPGDLEKMTPEQIFELFDVTKKIRTVEPFGFMRKRPEPKREKIDSDISETIREIEEKIETDEFKKWCSAAEISVYTTPTTKQDFEIHAENFAAAQIVLQTKEVPYRLRRAAADNITRDDIPHEKTAPGYASHRYYIDPEQIQNGIPAAVALWQLGATEQREFQRETAKAVGQYRTDRTLIFKEKIAGNINGIEYVETIEKTRRRMKQKIKNHKIERDNKINTNTDGLYFDILQNTQTRGSIHTNVQYTKGKILREKQKLENIMNEGKQYQFL